MANDIDRRYSCLAVSAAYDDSKHYMSTDTSGLNHRKVRPGETMNERIYGENLSFATYILLFGTDLRVLVGEHSVFPRMTVRCK